jgi:preprotein translocase subunit SecG
MSQNQGNAGVEEELHNTTGIMSVFFFQYSLFTNLSEKLGYVMSC